MIDGKPWGAVAVAPEHEAVDIQHDIKLLQDLAQKLRARRAKSGFLALQTIKLGFSFDENGIPTDTAPQERLPANELIEEVRSPCSSSTYVTDVSRLVHVIGKHVSRTANRSPPS